MIWVISQFNFFLDDLKLLYSVLISQKENETKQKNKMSASFVCFLGISLLMLLGLGWNSGNE